MDVSVMPWIIFQSSILAIHAVCHLELGKRSPLLAALGTNLIAHQGL